MGLSQEHPCPFLWHRLDEIPRGSSVSLWAESSGSEDCPAGLRGVFHPTQLSKIYPPCPRHGSISHRRRVTPSLSFPPRHRGWCHWSTGNEKEGSGALLQFLTLSIFHPAFLYPGSRYLDLRYLDLCPHTDNGGIWVLENEGLSCH